jgi:hypothetical protein
MRARVIILFLLLTAGSLWTMAQTNLEGHWEGAISAPGMELGMIVELKQEAGALSGTISIPAQGLKDFRLGNVKLQGQQVSFEMPNVPGSPTFTGTLSADGNSIEGTMTQGGGSVPFKLRRLSEAEIAEAAKKAAAEAARKPESVWEGTLNAGPSSLRLVVRVFKEDDGSLTGKLDSPDQGATGIAIPSLTLTDTKFSFELPALNGAFQGTLNQEKTEAVGEWSQMGNTFPLTLKKVEKP